MELLKTFTDFHDRYGDYQIYKLSDNEYNHVGYIGRYVLTKRLSNWALKDENIIDTLDMLKRDFGTVYGTSFCDTQKEAELTYKLSFMECLYNDTVRSVREAIGIKVTPLESYFAPVSVFDK